MEIAHLGRCQARFKNRAFPYAILKRTVDYSKNRHPTALHLLGMLFGKTHIGYYFIIYSYLKWMDDVIDRVDIKSDQALEFLDRQQELLAGNTEPGSAPEEMGAAIADFLRTEKGRALSRPLETLMSSFRDDALRRNRILTQDELMTRARKIGRGSLEICELLIYGRCVLDEAFKNRAADCWIKLDMLLDLEEDYRMGYVNIPREAFKTYDIPPVPDGDFADLEKAPGLQCWLEDSCSELEKEFSLMTRDIESVRPFLLKRFLRKMTMRKRRKLERLRERLALRRAPERSIARRGALLMLLGPTNSGKSGLARELGECGVTSFSFDKQYRMFRRAGIARRKFNPAPIDVHQRTLEKSIRAAENGARALYEGAQLMLTSFLERALQAFERANVSPVFILVDLPLRVLIHRCAKRERKRRSFRLVAEKWTLLFLTCIYFKLRRRSLIARLERHGIRHLTIHQADAGARELLERIDESEMEPGSGRPTLP